MAGDDHVTRTPPENHPDGVAVASISARLREVSERLAEYKKAYGTFSADFVMPPYIADVEWLLGTLGGVMLAWEYKPPISVAASLEASESSPAYLPGSFLWPADGLDTRLTEEATAAERERVLSLLSGMIDAQESAPPSPPLMLAAKRIKGA